ncbi:MULTISPECIES: phosphotransferase [unclassified Microbacterium]|uniref:phosphotransferase n=1 Tax=Microbacterium TaxID=33882 RepID=UPI003B9E0711
MPRSLLTLAAAATAAVPGAEVTGVRSLTAGGAGRFDAAVATLADGRELVVRVPVDEAAEREISAEIVALRALTSGVRELLGFDAPEFHGAVPFDGTSAVVTGYVRGYQVEASEIPPGRGVAESLGRAMAVLHALPGSVVRSAGLPVRTPDQSRADIERVLDAAGASGRVPVRLMVRWREAFEDDRLWAFESSVCLGGTQSTSFVLTDDVAGVPRVAGVLDWHGLSIDDPAVDLRWVASAPDASEDIHEAYAAAAHRAPDAALRVRARLHAELEFARWLVHGLEAHRPDVVDDAAALLESLSDGVRDDRLLAGLGAASSDVDDALAAIGRVPETTPAAVDTSMQTDAYDPAQLSLDGDGHWGERWDDADAADARITTDTVPEVRLPTAQPADDPSGATVPLDMEAYIAQEREQRGD